MSSTARSFEEARARLVEGLRASGWAVIKPGQRVRGAQPRKNWSAVAPDGLRLEFTARAVRVRLTRGEGSVVEDMRTIADERDLLARVGPAIDRLDARLASAEQSRAEAEAERENERRASECKRHGEPGCGWCKEVAKLEAKVAELTRERDELAALLGN